MLQSKNRACTKNLQMICKYSARADEPNERVKAVTADSLLLSQLLNNALREARELAKPDSAIEVQYAVIEKMATGSFRVAELANSRLVIDINFVSENYRAIS